MSEEISLSNLLKQADLDLLAAQYEYASALKYLSMSDEEERIFNDFLHGNVSLADVDFALGDKSRIEFLHRAINRFEYICLKVKQFKADPQHIDYQNSDFAIPYRFYEMAFKRQASLQSPVLPQAQNEPTPDDYEEPLSNEHSSVNYWVVFYDIGLAISFILGLVGAARISEKLGLFEEIVFFILSCIVYGALFIEKPKK